MTARASSRRAAGTRSVAVVGLACRYADAADAASLLDLVITGRRAFRRIPPCRIDLADYYSSDPRTPDATYCTRAALIEGWRFDHASFGVSAAAYAGADPAHWLALETAARALAAAGFAGGTGLPRDTAGVFIGNTLAGDVSRAAALRLRWPYSRRVIADAMYAAGVPADLARRVLRAAAARYLAPFPQVTAETLTGSMPATIATAICGHLGFRGGGRTVDAGSASSLAAIASACLALTSGELDVALAGGVDLSLDPLDLVGLAKSGMLATGEMRVYDAKPTGFLPGEGCGMVLLMRTADATAARLPVYAEILGWGIASGGGQGAPGSHPGTRAGHAATPGGRPAQHEQIAAEAASQLLAMRQAYRMARLDPVDVQLIEGSGTGLAVSDEAELTALAALRDGNASPVAALGSIAANIGNTRAAAGAASLIKAVLAITNGVLPPSAGTRTPHPMLRDGRARLRLPAAPEPWPDGTRHAAVGAIGTDGLHVHLVLRGPSGQGVPAPPQGPRARPGSRRARTAPAPGFRTPAAGFSPATCVIGSVDPAAYLVQAADRTALAATLARLADVAPWLSDGEMQDLAVQLAREAAGQAPARVALVASRQEQLARGAGTAVTLLKRLPGGRVGSRPGIFASEGASGRVTLLLGSEPHGQADMSQHALSQILAVLHWLDELGVQATAAVGHRIGELAGLVWAGCVAEADARELNAIRATALAASADAAPGRLSSAIDDFAEFEFRSPRRRLISASAGIELAASDAVAEVLSTELLGARLAARGRRPAGAGAGGQGGAGPLRRVHPADGRLDEAVRAGASGVSLLLQIGRDASLARAARAAGSPPVACIDGDPADARCIAQAAAALFAAGAITTPHALYAGRPGRPVDIWREQIFIANPCQVQPRFVGGSGVTGGAATPATAGSASADASTSEGHHGLVAAAPALVQPAGQATAAGQATPPAGVATWSRCYVEQPRAPGFPVLAADDRPWRIYTGGCDPLRREVSRLFRHDATAERTLAILGGPDDGRTIGVAVDAAKDAIDTGQLAVISPGPALTGLWASLHAEHPSIGITLVRAPLTPAGIEAAARIASVAPGGYRELAVDESGTVLEPVMTPVALPGGGDFPLGADDVVLISRSSGPAGLALAQVLACSGAAVAIIGRDHPDHDHDFIAELERLRCAGARVGYEVVDLASTSATVAAVRRIERRLGPVTAVAHAAGPTPSRGIADLAEDELTWHVREQTAVLDQMVTALRASALAGGQGSGRLRLIATFGSVVGRYGLAGEGILAMVTGALADEGERLACAMPGCRALHVDWPGWSGAGLGARPDLAAGMERAGFATMPVAEAARLLLKVLSTHGLPGRLAVHGRVGVPAPWVITIGGTAGPERPPGRFAERVLAHYPATELITHASLSVLTDPYLADYQADGVPMVPPAMLLEAMAQVASVLAGAPALTVTGLTMGAPLLLPGGSPGAATGIRICALRESDVVTVVVRGDRSGFAVDHCRATFTCGAAPAERRARRGRREIPPGAASAALDGSQLYGTVCFQDGRFRRLVKVWPAGSRSATALARGSDDVPWFGGSGNANEPAQRALLLGSPGISDAALQVVQACVPHRRLLFAGCESVSFSGRAAAGAVTLRATQAEPPGTVPPGTVAPGAVPRQRTAGSDGTSADQRPGPAGPGAQPEPAAGTRPGPAETVWDVEAVDEAGQPLITWRRLRMRDAGSLPLEGPWPTPLLSCYLERAAAELGLGPGVDVRVSGRDGDPRGSASARDGWARAAASGDDLAGFELRVRAAGRPAACAWQVVQPARPLPGGGASPAAGGAPERSGTDGGAWLAVIESLQRAQPGLVGPLADPSADPAATAAAASAAAAAHAGAIAACLGAPAPPDVTVSTRNVAGADWLLVRTGEAHIASVLLDMAGVAGTVAVAIRVGAPARPARPGSRGNVPAASAGQAARAARKARKARKGSAEQVST